MKEMLQTHARTLGLFEQRIAGDDSLMKLASKRFREASMGAEMHAGTLEHLEWVMDFRPRPELPALLHLPRDLNLLDARTQNQINLFAIHFAGRIFGMILHDHRSMVTCRKDYLEAARRLNDALSRIRRAPILFIEYAVGLEPADFTGFFSTISDLDRISACIDIGHVGIRAARDAYARHHQGHDICALKDQNSSLPQLMPAVEAAVASGFTSVLDLIRAIGALNKPIHFHLHDGHPLSRFSAFGVSDHLSFLTEIPLDFEYRGARTIRTMFGRAGLSEVVRCALASAPAERISFTLEIHPTGERLGLGDAAPLFAHWTDKTNAEQMNHWLVLLSRNHELLLHAIQAGLRSKPRSLSTEAPRL